MWSPSHSSRSPLNEDLDDQALYSPWNGGLTRDILKRKNGDESTQPLHEKPIPVTRVAAPPASFPVIERNVATLLPTRPKPPKTAAEKEWQRRKVLRHLSRRHLRAARASEYRTRRHIWTTIGIIALVLLLLFLSVGSAGTVVAYRFYTQTQNKYEHSVVTLRDLLPLDNLKIYDSKGVLLAQLTDQGLHTTVKFDQIAPLLRDATVATEDKTFWTNQGVDLLRILRAALDDAQNGRVVEGGSTITQQLIKILLVGNQATIERKLKELVLTPLINNRYSKRDILEMYLNSIYYGHQAYGIDAAATAYFGLQDKPGQPAAMQLDLAQSAMLAGIPSNPHLYDPLLHSDAAYTVLPMSSA